MSFGLGVVLYVIGTVLVAICLLAIPGPSGAAAGSHAPHGGHGGH